MIRQRFANYTIKQNLVLTSMTLVNAFIQGGDTVINHSRYRLFLMISSILATLSVAMFIYQHFFYENRRLKELSTIYVVASAVDAHDAVTAGDLKEVKIPKQALVEGMITDLTKLNEVPHYALHSLTKGEILVDSQLTTENLHNEGDLLVPLTGNHISEIAAGDMVSFYTLAPEPSDESSTPYVVKKLFSSKKVYATGRLNDVTEVIDGETIQFYIKVTEEEMHAYYQALKTSEIIVAKHMVDVHAMIDDLDNFDIQPYDELNTNSSTSTGTSSSNSNSSGNNLNNNSTSNENSNSQSDNTIGTLNPPLSTDKEEGTEEENTDENRSTVLYRVGENDTWETIAMKFKTDKNTLYKLNPDVLTIRKGTELLVPSI